MKTVALVTLLFVHPAAGQNRFGDLVPVNLIVENGSRGLTVELYSSSSHMRVAGAEISSSGRVNAGRVEPGMYEVRVVDENGGLVWTEYVSMTANSQSLFINLPERSAANRPGMGMVSFNTLVRENGRSMKLVRQSLASYGRGNLDDAVAKLRKAIDEDPSFALAHHDLAVRYLQSGRPSDARNELLKAIELDPKPARPYENLSIADLALENPVGAEQAALHALEREPNSAKARLLRDVALWKQGRGPRPANPAMDH